MAYNVHVNYRGVRKDKVLYDELMRDLETRYEDNKDLLDWNNIDKMHSICQPILNCTLKTEARSILFRAGSVDEIISKCLLYCGGNPYDAGKYSITMIQRGLGHKDRIVRHISDIQTDSDLRITLETPPPPS